MPRQRNSVTIEAIDYRFRGNAITFLQQAVRRTKGEDTMDKKEQKQMTAGKEIIPEKAVQKEETKQESAPEIILQYREYEASIDAVTDRVKSHYYAKGHAHGSIESIQIYVKPEDFTAYYVINDGVVGKVNLF